jgi:hypothetical protein
VCLWFLRQSRFLRRPNRAVARKTGGAGSTSTPARNTPINPKYTTPKSPLDTAYGAKIAEYTTEKYFMTELVDHLPLSDKVPSPEKSWVTRRNAKQAHLHKDLYRYYRELAAASPRVRVLIAPEKSEEGREQMLVLVSDEANLAKLDRYKEITAKLADPRKISDTEAQTLIAKASRSTGLPARFTRPKPARRRC